MAGAIGMGERAEPLARFRIGYSLLRCAWNFSNISRCRSCFDLRAEPSGPSRRTMKNSDKVHRPLLVALTAETIPLRIQAPMATSMVSPLPFPAVRGKSASQVTSLRPAFPETINLWWVLFAASTSVGTAQALVHRHCGHVFRRFGELLTATYRIASSQAPAPPKKLAGTDISGNGTRIAET
jgi:hypothetical protein